MILPLLEARRIDVAFNSVRAPIQNDLSEDRKIEIIPNEIILLDIEFQALLPRLQLWLIRL